MAINGNAAGAFMSGFMSGYKFVDDMATKKKEREDADKKAKLELAKTKVDEINSAQKSELEVVAKLAEADKVYYDGLKNETNPESILRNYNFLQQQKYQIQQDAYDVKNKRIEAVKGTELADIFASNNPAPTAYDPFQAVVTNNGSKFLLKSAADSNIIENLALPENQRTYQIIDTGELQEKSTEGWKTIRKLDPLTSLIGSVKTEKQANDQTFFPIEELSDEERKYFYSKNINKPTFQEVQLYRKTLIDPNKETRQIAVKDMPKGIQDKFIQQGFTVDSLVDVSVYNKYIEPQDASKGGMETQTFEALKAAYIAANMSEAEAAKKAMKDVESLKQNNLSFGDIQVQQYIKSGAAAKGISIIQWSEMEKTAGTASGGIQAKTYGSGLSDSTTKYDRNTAISLQEQFKLKATPEEQKSNEAFTKQVSFKNKLDAIVPKLIRAIDKGTFKSGLIDTAVQTISDYTPEKLLKLVSGGDAFEQFRKQSGLDNEMAKLVVEYQVAVTGLSATNSQYETYKDIFYGGSFKDENARKEKINAFYNQLKQDTTRAAQDQVKMGWVYDGGEYLNKSANKAKMQNANPKNTKPKFDKFSTGRY